MLAGDRGGGDDGVTVGNIRLWDVRTSELSKFRNGGSIRRR